MFVDASAIVAILTREPEADALADLLETARSPTTSPIAILEAALGICRKRHASVDEAEKDIGEFLEMSVLAHSEDSFRFCPNGLPGEGRDPCQP
jgi:ribonuclease VapC